MNIPISVNPELISQEALLQRPLKTAVYIDPPNPLEVDDAIRVETIGSDADERLVSICIANGGLLLGQTAIIDCAREQGWTEYNDRNPSKTKPILPSRVYKDALGLDSDAKDGVPAIELTFGFNLATRKFGELALNQVRLRTKGFTYVKHDKLLSSPKSSQAKTQAVLMKDVAKTLFAKPDRKNKLRPEAQSEDIVHYFMYAANVLMAQHVRKLDLPWLFRNHNNQAYLTWHNARQREVLTRINPGSYGLRPIGHQGLGWIPEYCHFTSPLRRFPDLANHLNLQAHLMGVDIPYDEAEIEQIGREMTAKYIDRHPRNFSRAA